MTKEVKGAGRRRYAASRAKHDQRTPLPPRNSTAIGDARRIFDEAVREQKEKS